ncbi:MAG: hypothetical protein HMLKMBBP_02432 [Planctomycetes bacterium]|nr:hypothetical protein [Planctomycetota bacterium]
MRGVVAVVVGVAVVAGAAGFLAGTVAGGGGVGEERVVVPAANAPHAPVADPRPAKAGARPEDPETPRDLASLPYVGRNGGREAPKGADAAEILDRIAERPVTDARREEAVRRAAKLREFARLAAERADAIAARQTLDAIEREEDLAAELAAGGVLRMLRGLLRAPALATDLAGNGARMAEHSARVEGGPSIDGTRGASEIRAQIAAAVKAGTGAEIRFPAGFHELDTAAAVGGGSQPADLVVAGAGMDVTLVRAASFTALRDVRGLTFRNLTIDCGGSPLVVARGAVAALRFERCRFIGFDCGGPTPVVVAADACFVLARECRFEAGFGRMAGTGGILQTSAAVARFEKCTFTGPFAWIAEDGPGRTYAFDGCTFQRVTSTLLPALTPNGAPEGVSVRASSASDPIAPGAAYLPQCAFLWSIAPPQGARALEVIVDRYPAAFALPHDRGDWDFAFRDVPGMHAIDPASMRAPKGATNAIVKLGDGVTELRLGDALPGLLIVQGQGRDETLVRIGSLPRAGTLVFRDLTIDCAKGGVGPEGAQRLAFLGVRFVRFDEQRSSTTAVRADRGFLWTWNCEFADGFGRWPGTAIRMGAQAVAVIDETVFDLAGSGAFETWTPERVHVRNSRITGHASIERDARAGPGPHWRDTKWETVPPDFQRPKDPRPLSELNPGWK